jgi:hypothetical protein
MPFLFETQIQLNHHYKNMARSKNLLRKEKANLGEAFNFPYKYLLVLYNTLFFLNSHSGGWSPNWVHSARRPLNGLLYLPRVIMMMENLVE